MGGYGFSFQKWKEKSVFSLNQYKNGGLKHE